MTLHLVQVSAHVTQPVVLNIPIELWQFLLSITPDGFSVQDTVLKALTDFVEQEAVNTAGKG